MSNNQRQWSNVYNHYAQQYVPIRAVHPNGLPVIGAPMQTRLYGPRFPEPQIPTKENSTASEFAQLFADESTPREEIATPQPPKPHGGYIYQPPLPIIHTGPPNMIPVVAPFLPHPPRPITPVENKTPIQMSFIDAIVNAKEKKDDKSSEPDIERKETKPTPIAESLKMAISGDILVQEPKITVEKSNSTSDILVAQQIQSSPVKKATTPYKIQRRRPEVAANTAEPSKTPVQVQKHPSTQPVKKPDVEQSKKPDDVPEKRFMYTIMAMIQLRTTEESKRMPEVFARSEGQDRYLRTFKSQKRYSAYTRSKDSWVITKERLSKLDKTTASTESTKITLQKTLNKITKASFDKFVKDFLQPGFATPEIADILIDRIFSAVISNNPCIEEYAQLIKSFDSFYRQNNNDSDHFISRAISVFKEGARIKPEWLTKYNQVLHRKAATIDELDEKNEELQSLEQSQRFILNGAAKILAYLMLKNLIPVSEAINFIQSVSKSTHELEIEMLCVYFKLIMPTLQKNKNVKTIVDDVFKKLENDRKTYQMRLRYIILDMVTLHKNNWNVPKSTVTVTTKNIPTLNKDNIMAPNRTPGRPLDITKGIANNPFSSLANKSKIEEIGNKNNQKYQNRQSKPQKVDSQNNENKSTQKINVESTKTIVYPILDDFALDYDFLEIIYNMKDLEVTSHMNVFVNVAFQYLIEKFNTHHIYYGQMFHFLIKRDRLSPQLFLKGLKKFMKGFNLILDDLPIASKIVARIITPLIISHSIEITDYYDILVKRNINNINGCIVSLIETIAEYTNKQTACEVIQSSKSNDVLTSIYGSIDSIKTKQPYIMIVTGLPSESPEILIKSPDFKATLSSMTPDDLNLFINDFAALIHHCCPPWGDALKKYITELCKEYDYIFSVFAKTNGSVKNLIKAIKFVFDRAHKQPLRLFLTLFEILVKEHQIDCDLIKDTISKFDDEMLDAEIFELRNSS